MHSDVYYLNINKVYKQLSYAANTVSYLAGRKNTEKKVSVMKLLETLTVGFSC